ncbi:Agamous-like MADS-box protein AGL65 [Linum perenne]
MGRVKLKIKKLESTSNRQVTYSKRRHGILKKAKELSILCDIDILLLMFSPTGRPTLFNGERGIEDVIAKFAQLTPQERAKRKMESLETLKKTFKKLDHDVNIQAFFGARGQTVEEVTDQARVMQAQLTESHRRLSYWMNPEKVDSIEQIQQMEASIRESLSRICLHKENIKNHQLMSLDCSSQFQNGMQLPLMMNGLHDTNSLSWLANNGGQNLVLTDEPNALHHSSMMVNYKDEQRDMECSTESSAPGYHGFFSSEKQPEIGNPGLMHNIGHQAGQFNELGSSSRLTLQLGEQFPYDGYGSLCLAADDGKKFELQMEDNLNGNHNVYQVDNNNEVEIPRPVYDNGHNNWITEVGGPSGVGIFDQNPPYPQVKEPIFDRQSLANRTLFCMVPSHDEVVMFCR